jgi:choline transporter-like protein 2/4/5
MSTDEVEMSGLPIEEGDKGEGGNDGRFDANDVDHKCTDIIWIPIFLIFWFGMLGIMGFAVTKGDPNTLIYARDYAGSLCVEQNVHYPTLQQDLIAMYKEGNTDPTTFKLNGICMNTCPSKGEWVCDTSPNGMFLGQAHAGLGYDPKVAEQCVGGKTTDKASGPKDATCYLKTDAQLDTCAENFFTNPLDGKVSYTGNDDGCKALANKCWKTTQTYNNVMYRCLPKAATPDVEYTYICGDHVWDPAANGGAGAKVTVVNICRQSDPATKKGTNKAFSACRNITDGAGNWIGQTCTQECKSDSTGFGGTFKDENGGYTCKRVNTTLNRKSQDAPAGDAFVQQLAQVNGQLSSYMADIKACFMPILIGGFALAFVFGFVWVFVLKWCICCIVWMSIFLALLLLTLTSIFALIKGGVITSDMVAAVDPSLTDQSATVAGTTFNLQKDEQYANEYKWGGIVLAITTAVLFFIILGMRNRIALAIAIITEAGNVLKDMPTTVFYPFFTLIAFVILLVYFLFVGAMISSMGDITAASLIDAAGNATGGATSNINVTLPAAFTAGPLNNYLLIYHFFGFLWTNQVIQGIGIMAIGGCAGNWYWSEEEEKKDMSKFEVFKQAKCALRYHIGSAIFGGFIIAFVQLIRAALAYLDEKTKDMQESNIAMKIAMKIVQCCLYCFEKCLKFLSRNAYILVIVQSRSFCSGAKESFKLIIANILRMGAAAAVSSIVITLGKMFICMLCTLITYNLILMRVGITTQVSGVILPTFIACIVSYIVASCFLYVYGVTIDTILLMFCLDEKENKDGKFFASASLKKCLPASKDE